MPIPVLMPALSPTMEKGNLAKWVKQQGDKVKSGDIIAEIETDKATMEVEATDEGTLGQILVPEGTADVAVNTPIAVILSEGEDAGALNNFHAEAPAQPRAGRSTGAESAPPAAAEAPAAPRGAAPPRRRSRRPRRRRSPPPLPEPDVPDGTEMVTMTVREALRDAMAEEMRRDADVFVMGEEVAEYQGAYKVTQGLLQEFGTDRVIDTPITEHGFAGLGVGAALAGLKPIVEFMTFNFAMQAMDQLINSAAKTLYMSGGQMGCSIVFRGPNGAAARVAAQHSQDYSSWYSHIPGLTVIAPYTAADAKGLLKSAIRYPNPVIFLENEILYGHSSPVPKLDDYLVPIGKAKVARPGEHVTLVAWSMGMTYALKAAEELAKEDIYAEVIDLRTLRPMDTATDRRVGEEDRPLRRGRGGLAAVRRRRRGRGAHHGERVRLSRRAGRARLRQGRADALRGQSREARAAVGRRGGRGRQSGRATGRRACPHGRPTTMRIYEALVIPNEALDKGGIEILRAGLVDDELYVTARRAFDDPGHLGRGAGRDHAAARPHLRGGGRVQGTRKCSPRSRAPLRPRPRRAGGIAAPRKPQAGDEAQAGSQTQAQARSKTQRATKRPTPQSQTVSRCRSTSSCRRCRPPWRRAISPSGSRRKATRSRPATSSPRSRPTRRRWKSRRSTTACWRRSWCRKAPPTCRSIS